MSDPDSKKAGEEVSGTRYVYDNGTLEPRAQLDIRLKGIRRLD